ncbi:restriction endonuclease subunit S [Enterococcus faecalis]|uniref:restriction endonuclease subunit S n=1 Tax=Enterococcus faecalis TaxID=1351 RepID=UPI000CF15C50|nr:restriction endonuclease subunit S [Enterococcus faecalis]EGO8945233.1 restriction endonuclease subunit S [Enterococcus faecalis]EHZ5794747.1 restriction endonuclease subunit S [Enterococcus faecalis]EIY5981624.1 restriction endonuclease subunit S [Enterococcus faecalis]EIY7150785.1 restriction endonuclease subunit S [Enterococcus faecalis]EJZ8624323.1 restriction endonuclease subunit S [Enterococcus faecalis]
MENLFNYNWELCKVKDFLIESKIKGSNGKIAKKLTVKLWRKGIVAKEEVYEGSLATQYYVRKSGQFMYGKLDFLNQAFGIVPIELDGYESTVDSPSFDFKPLVDSVFFLEYVSLEKFYKYQGNIANGSRKAKRIHVETFFNMPLPTPSYKEQQKIGTLFKQLDDTITLHQRKLDQLKELKKAYLQVMFPAKDERAPKLRFADFEGEWEQCKLGNILTERNTQQSKSKEYPLVSFTVEDGVTPKTERYEREQLVRGDKSSKKYKVTELNDIVYNPANLKFGAIARNHYGKAVFSPIYITFIVNDKLACSSYVEVFITRKDFISYSLKYQQGTVYERQSVSPENLLNMKFLLPNTKEQEFIGHFFEKLDCNSNFHKKKITQLKNLKKSYLQNMFI